MIKKLSLILLVLSVMFACDLEKEKDDGLTNYTTKSPGTGTLYGKVYNGLTRTAITKTSSNSLAGTLTAGKTGSITSINASFDSNGYYYFSNVPLDTKFSVEFSDGTTYTSFIATLTITPTAVNNVGDTAIYYDHKSELRNIYLFPADANPGDLTIEIYDANNALISSAGTVLLKPIANTGLNNGTIDILTNEIDLATKVSGTLASGTVTIPAASLILGVQYTIEVYGVTGYDFKTSGDTVTLNSTSATTHRVALTAVEDGATPKVIARSDFNSYIDGSTTVYVQEQSGGTVTFTFDRNIELDPNSQYLAEITDPVTQTDNDNDSVVNVLATFTGTATAATPVVSNHITLTASGNTLTIAVKSGYLSTEDTGDELSIEVLLSNIAIRASGATSVFTKLNDANLYTVADWNDATIVVRDISVLE